MDRGHITIDGHCQTNVKGLYAIGDCAGAPWLAHKASHEGIHAAEHIAGKCSISRADQDRFSAQSHQRAAAAWAAAA